MDGKYSCVSQYEIPSLLYFDKCNGGTTRLISCPSMVYELFNKSIYLAIISERLTINVIFHQFCFITRTYQMLLLVLLCFFYALTTTSTPVGGIFLSTILINLVLHVWEFLGRIFFSPSSKPRRQVERKHPFPNLEKNCLTSPNEEEGNYQSL